jgi:cyclopropane fatty-acyl-phospholipid synthase-like methyltransferase
LLEHCEACERNKRPILDILRDVLADRRRVLEIGAGTGQHAVFFSRNLDHVTWEPTERADGLPALRARVEAEGGGNLSAPLQLDVNDDPWPRSVRDREYDAVYSANTLHIMSWMSVEALFDGVGKVLGRGGALCVYGPFKYGGEFTTPSNARFDASLRAWNPDSGIRDFEAVHALAGDQGLELLADHAMPANNQLLLWHRRTIK